MKDLQQLQDQCRTSVLANDDLLPTKQTWTWYSIFAFWMSDVHSAGGYIVAGSLFSLGLSGWQVVVSLLVGIMFVHLFANIMGVPSQRCGVPFPVMSRMSFGVLGSNIPALIRGIIATVWYGIQTYLASAAFLVVLLHFFPELVPYAEPEYSWLGLSALGWFSLMVIWALQTALFLCQMEAIKKFIDWAGPLVYVVMVILMIYIIVEAGWENISFSLSDKELTTGQQIWTMVMAMGIVIAYFAGPVLNYGDFSRYCRSLKDMRRGNFWGLPVNFLFFAVVAVITISGTPVVFGKLIQDPIEVMGHLDNKWAALLLGFMLLTATVGVNIVANFVSAAFDISNVFPRAITWRIGGMIAAVVSIIIQPWNLFSSPEVIQYTVETLASFIGPVYGIIACDYYLVHRSKVCVEDLYSMDAKGYYWYSKGVNLRAVACLLPAAFISVGITFTPAAWGISSFACVVGALLSAALYYAANHLYGGPRRPLL